MRIIVFGGTGTIGSAVVAALRDAHDVISVGRSSGDRHADLTSRESLERLFEDVGHVDALVSCAGNAVFRPLGDLTDADFQTSLRSKLMGQINLVRHWHDQLSDGGSVTLTSGILAQQPVTGSAAISLVNAGIEGFVRAAALELPRDLRVNAVSPPWAAETLEEMGRDPEDGLPAARIARAYVEAVTGTASGEVISPE